MKQGLLLQLLYATQWELLRSLDEWMLQLCVQDLFRLFAKADGRVRAQEEHAVRFRVLAPFTRPLLLEAGNLFFPEAVRLYEQGYEEPKAGLAHKRRLGLATVRCRRG